ncbi:hypothetical protein ACFPDQ_04470 [Pseudofrancisella aestuarii]|uniref:Uncharacterized protein n=1 Tax=Pseudofrancisella aestuarii TaxID=2670347 RepID=A0ABV9TAY3_9GAMM|nr:hypothetical protein [Pseudofrancisella aestuarii]
MKKTILTFIILTILSNSSFALQSCVTDRQDSVIPGCQYIGDFSDDTAVNTLTEANNTSSNVETSEPDNTSVNSSPTPTPQKQCQWWQLFCHLGWW